MLSSSTFQVMLFMISLVKQKKIAFGGTTEIGCHILKKNNIKQTNLSLVPSMSSVNKIPVTAPRMGNLSTVSSPVQTKAMIKN